MRTYIQFARRTAPRLTEEASEAIASCYVKMRNLNGKSGKTISATTRQLESLIRLSEAHAKVR